MKLSKSGLSLIIAALLVLPACNQEKKTCNHSESCSRNGVSVKVEQLSKSQANSLFEGRGRHLIKTKDPIIPLRVTVENRNSYAVMVKPATMAITDSNIIYSQVKKNTAGIATAGTIGGLFIVPIVGAAIGAGCGISSAKKNDRILNEISQNAFIEPREVYPQSSLNKIMFVKKSDFQPVFSLPVGSYMHMVDLSKSMNLA